jgi:cytochrome c oxidase subunit III
MSTINAHPSPGAKPMRWETYKHEHHWRSAADEFDAAKLGMWLFLTTEVLLFGGIFCSYAIFRMLYPEAFANGSAYLNWRIGLLNTVVLLLSSFTVAMSVRCAQLNKQKWLKINLILTLIFAAAFVTIKGVFEYYPKLSAGKAPGAWFSYPWAHNPEEPIWWGIYYAGTGIHALHVFIGAGLILWVLVRSFKGIYGPKNYTMVETSGLYWHLVDLVWIFLFPLLYLIH